LALIRALLVSADIDKLAGDTAGARTACLGALDIFGPDAPLTRDYRILDPWVRVNYCLGNEHAAGQAAGRLRSFGYSDRNYLMFLSLQNKMKGKS
jgi:hypothetical protein